MAALTPKQIVAELDRHIVGQAEAKRAVAVAVRNRWRRQQLSEEVAREVTPKNILMVGPTGVGKTEIARRLATLTKSPFVKVEATKFTEVGYHGRDVDAMIRDLLDVAIHLIREELRGPLEKQADRVVEDKLLDLLLPASASEVDDSKTRTRERFRQKLREGEMEGQFVEVAIDRKPNVAGMMGQSMGQQIDPAMESMFERLLPSRKETRKVTIAEARVILRQQEVEKLIDKDKVIAAAVQRCEQSGIVFIDEIDKVASSGKEHGPDVSRQGVQRDLLPIVEGSTVVTKHGPIKTDHILFIAAGAFHSSKPSDLMPELLGRFPIRVELSDLTKADFVRILREPKNALTYQQIALLGVEGVKLNFTDDAVESMAQMAYDLNRKTQNIGARRLHTIVERVLDDLSFSATDMSGTVVEIDAAYVQKKLSAILEDEDLSKFVL